MEILTPQRAWLATLLCASLLALSGCARGSTSVVPGDTRPDTNSLEGDWRPHLPRDRGPGGKDGGRPPKVDLAQSSPAQPDQDGDGHCPKGAKDPKGLCKSFNDCDDKDNTRYPGALESCKNVGKDNDCDGDAKEVDLDKDGKSDLGTACPTGLPGVCASGQRRCDKGSLICKHVTTVGQRPEVCNGLDDDCDGTPDNGKLCARGNACLGNLGCRCGKSPACTGSQSCCGGTCHDLAKDPNNCGACGSGCGPGETCDNGACRCGTTLGPKGGGPACSSGTCTGGACVNCQAGTNLALSASASSSGGGSGSHGPAAMNDGLLQSTCGFHWVKAGSAPDGKWIQYSWSSPVQVGRVWFDTNPLGGACSLSAGRCLAGGTLQYWTGSGWKSLATISGRTDDWQHSFPRVTTTRLRFYDLYAPSSTGQKSNPVIYEWRVYCK